MTHCVFTAIYQSPGPHCPVQFPPLDDEQSEQGFQQSQACLIVIGGMSPSIFQTAALVIHTVSAIRHDELLVNEAWK